MTTFIVDGGVFSAGSALAWLESLGVDVGPEAHERLPALDSTVQVLPAFDGIGAPHWDRRASASIAGLTSATTGDDLLKGLLDAIAFRVAEIVDIYLDAGFPRPETIRVDGGLSRSRYLMQRQADVLGLPVSVGMEPEATAYGAALMSGVSSGHLTTSDVLDMTSSTELLEPRESAKAKEDFRSWKEFCQRVRPTLRDSG